MDRLYILVATAIVALFVGAAGALQVQSWRYGEQIAKLEAQQETERATAQAAARTAEQAITTKYQGALNEARTRESLLRTELDRLHVVSDSLRDQAADAARRLAAAPAPAVLEYALAVNAIYDDCRAAYGDMAAKATGHASDVVTHRDSWPVNPHRPAVGSN